MTSPHRFSTEYEACLREMYALRRFGIKLELTTIATILAGLGNPQNRFAAVHIAGTNGKGSIAAMLATILHMAGYRTGRYTSPHLESFTERIILNNRRITEEQVLCAYRAVKNQHGGQRPPTFFEYTTAMAFYEFARQKVELAVIETGMGGRFDATNILQPCLSIISNISLEHQMYLGGTLSDIAGEKAGIIKPKVPVITGVRQKKALQKIATVARTQKAPLYRLGGDFRIRRTDAVSFSYYGLRQRWRNLSPGLRGSHQHQNAALVLAACEILRHQGYTISTADIRRGLTETRWPGRLEVVSTAPFILIDGAHNLAAAKSLARYITDHLADKAIILIIGMLDDKAYPAILKTLVPLCRTVILTRPRIERALAPEVLKNALPAGNRETILTSSVAEAISLGLDRLSVPEEALCIAGSLYVAGEAKTALQKLGISSPGEKAPSDIVEFDIDNNGDDRLQ